MKKLNLSIGVKFALILFACATLLTSCYNKYGKDKELEPEYSVFGNVTDEDGNYSFEYSITFTPAQVGNIQYTQGSRQTPNKYFARLPKAGTYSYVATPINQNTGEYKEKSGTFTVSKSNPSFNLNIVFEYFEQPTNI